MLKKDKLERRTTVRRSAGAAFLTVSVKRGLADCRQLSRFCRRFGPGGRSWKTSKHVVIDGRFVTDTVRCAIDCCHGSDSALECRPAMSRREQIQATLTEFQRWSCSRACKGVCSARDEESDYTGK